LISNQVDEVARPCEVFDLTRLRQTGSLAFDVAENGDLLIETAHSVAGGRPWNARRGERSDPLILRAQTQKRAAEATQFSDMRQP
jgi:competence protein ComEC